MLVARLDSARGIADIAHIAPTRLLHDAFGPGDTWFVTGDLLRIDGDGDYWFVDRAGDVILTRGGPVPSRRIEDTLHQLDGVIACVAVAIADRAHVDRELPAAAFALEPTAAVDLDALARVVVALPAHARPVRLRRVASIPETDGFRPLKQPIRELGFADGPDVYAWDPTTNRYRPTA